MLKCRRQNLNLVSVSANLVGVSIGTVSECRKCWGVCVRVWI